MMNVSFIGSKLFRSFSTWFVDVITWKSCIQNEPAFNATISIMGNNCANDFEITQCIEIGGNCKIVIDGYYIEMALNVLYGMIWFRWGLRTIEYLQKLPLSDWYVLSKRADCVMYEVTPLAEKSNDGVQETRLIRQ